MAQDPVHGRADGSDPARGGSRPDRGGGQTFQADDVRRLKQLEAENARLKKLVAERDLEIEVMKEINAKK